MCKQSSATTVATPSSSSIAVQVRTSSLWRPTLRDPLGGWKHFAAVVYALVADVLGFHWMIEEETRLVKLTAAILLAAHGRVVATYLVHEAAHSSIFIEPKANRYLGILCLWLAGSPYTDFDYVRKLHIAHHHDRADVGEFDYRRFVNKRPILRNLVLAMEWAFIPAVETILHLRAAFFPVFKWKVCSDSRLRSALIGVPVMFAFYAYLWHKGALLPHFIAGALIVHFLSMHDAFQHTYEVILVEDYAPGPGSRTAQYEEENTFSNLISVRYPLLNIFSLNFGYHNAHHAKPMMPWYNLPNLHNQLYKGNNASSSDDGINKHAETIVTMPSPQLLPFCDLVSTWHKHRLRRVVEEDYGVVHPPGQPGRADDFVGTLGVSFLTS